MLSEILKEVNKFTSYRGVPISHLRRMSSRLHGNTSFIPKWQKHRRRQLPAETHLCNRPPPENLRGTENPLKNAMKIRCSKIGSKSALWEPMGRPREPREPRHGQNWSQKAAKMSQKTAFFWVGLDKWKMRRNIIIYYISSTSATPGIGIF